MQKLFLNAISDRILKSVHSDARALVLHELQIHNAQVYVLAGAIRDALNLEYNGIGTETPRDIDIAVSGVSREFFDSVLKTYGVRNRHGGYVLTGHMVPSWDVWRLEDSVGLRKTNTPPSVENMLRTFNLSCNAIALDIRTGTLIDAGAIDSIRKRHLGFVRNAIVHSKATFAAKGLLSQMRFSYTVELGLHNFIANYLDYGTLLHESLKTFPGIVVLPDKDLLKLQSQSAI
jgi:hypothetical protein